MLKKYSQEEMWAIYEKLPEDIKDFLLSEHEADEILNISKRNNVSSSRLAEIAGYVLMGLLPPTELKKTLEMELKITSELANKVSLEIERFILYPVKTSLTDVYRLDYKQEKTSSSLAQSKPLEKPEIFKSTDEESEASEIIEPPIEPKKKPTISYKEKKQSGQEDTYRESIGKE